LRQDAYSGDLGRLLGLGGNWRREEATPRATMKMSEAIIIPLPRDAVTSQLSPGPRCLAGAISVVRPGDD
jgi:hypothetical protein